MKVAIINPLGRGHPKKRNKHKRKFTAKHKRKFHKRKFERFSKNLLNTKMAKKRRGKKRKNPFANRFKSKSRKSYKRRNPLSANPRRKRGRKHYRRNPELLGLSVGMLANAAMGATIGIIAQKLASNAFQMEGYGKYLFGAGLAFVAYWGLSKVYKPAAMPAAVAIATLYINEFIDESGLLDGIAGLLGLNGNYNDAANVLEWQNYSGLGQAYSDNGGAVPLTSGASYSADSNAFSDRG